MHSLLHAQEAMDATNEEAIPGEEEEYEIARLGHLYSDADFYDGSSGKLLDKTVVVKMRRDEMEYLRK